MTIVTPDRRLRVFVSSTMVELAAERTAARETIETLRLTPVLFELGARPHPPRALYRAYVEQSDVFVGVYGESYGWIGPGMDVSGLEDEYRLAAGKPRLLYVKRPAPAREERLAALLDEIRAESTVSYRPFGEADELGRLLADDLAVLLSERFQEPSSAPPRSRLPAAVDRFVGRGEELATLRRLLLDDHARLVTIVGTGGVGKTRLALEAARLVSDTFAGGTHFVGLSSVGQADRVPAALLDALAVESSAASSPLDAVLAHLDDAEVLLVVDNLEHVLDAAPVLARLLEECPGLTLLATSRAPLRLKGEHELPLAPLAIGDEDDGRERGPGAVELFDVRARAADPSFALSDDIRPAVVEICRRLDGLPLAIELAAAHVRLLPPPALLARLDRSLALTARGWAAYPDRQRTLGAAIDWSYGLLAPAEQALLARASVFRGGWTLEALEAVCAAGEDVLEPLAALVEHSLVTQEASLGEPRFSMLRTIREYAAAKLEELGDAAATRERHGRFYLQLVQESGARLRAEGHGSALARLDSDEDNVHAALARFVDDGEYERVAEAAWALVPYWSLRERVVEGRRWLETVLERGHIAPLTRARTVAAAALLAFWASDHETAVAKALEALPELEALGDDAGRSVAQIPLGVARAFTGDVETGLALLEDSRETAERLGAEWGVAMALVARSWALNLAGAEAPLELFEEALEHAGRLGHEAETLAIGALGRRHALRGEAREAKEVLGHALRRAKALQARLGTALYLDALGDLAAAEGEDEWAVRLSTAAGAVAAGTSASVPPLAGDREARLATLRERLGDGRYEDERRTASAWTVDEATAAGLAFAEAAAGVESRPA